jgi:hypothetical protein
MKNKLKTKYNKMKKTLYKKKLECLFLIGLIIITTTNFTVNIIFACYFLGMICILFAVYLDFIKGRR